MATLYSRYFTPAENQFLASQKSDDLSSEIKLFRILLMRLLSSEQAGGHPLSLEQRLAGLRVISFAVSSLAGLLHLQNKYSNPMDEFWECMMQALDELNREEMMG